MSLVTPFNSSSPSTEITPNTAARSIMQAQKGADNTPNTAMRLIVKAQGDHKSRSETSLSGAKLQSYSVKLILLPFRIKHFPGVDFSDSEKPILIEPLQSELIYDVRTSLNEVESAINKNFEGNLPSYVVQLSHYWSQRPNESQPIKKEISLKQSLAELLPVFEKRITEVCLQVLIGAKK